MALSALLTPPKPIGGAVFPLLGPRSPLGFDPRAAKRPRASRRFPRQEEGRPRRVSVPSPRPIRRLSPTLCPPLRWVNPYPAAPGAPESVTDPKKPPALARPTRPGVNPQESRSKFRLLMISKRVPQDLRRKNSSGLGFIFHAGLESRPIPVALFQGERAGDRLIAN